MKTRSHTSVGAIVKKKKQSVILCWGWNETNKGATVIKHRFEADMLVRKKLGLHLRFTVKTKLILGYLTWL